MHARGSCILEPRGVKGDPGELSIAREEFLPLIWLPGVRSLLTDNNVEDKRKLISENLFTGTYVKIMRDNVKPLREKNSSADLEVENET